MRKLIVVMIVIAGLVTIAWSGKRPNHNRPRTFTVSPSPSAQIPVAFSSSDTLSLISTDLRGQGYQHLSVANDTKSPVRVMTQATTGGSTDYNPFSVQIASSGAHAFDDISILKNLFLRSEDNSIAAGTVRINVW